ncbi:Copper transporter [Handroanthus impetiginosus]|uniref:Copper transport protein n=1 Tax=Handroanthus impetiginosus TaxID=429701 RepID=A0A2G9GSM8_9LAMI|nr:Copper transporter [Handroanthus impetiginosus]
MSHEHDMPMSPPYNNQSMPMPMSPPYNNQSMMTMDDMSMHMAFYWGKDVIVLFAGWPGSGRLGMYILALLTVFVLAAAAEILSVGLRLKPRGLGPLTGALIQAAVYGFRMGLAYLVMLSVMSFNIGVFVAAVAGHAVGFFVVKYRQLTAVARAVDF